MDTVPTIKRKWNKNLIAGIIILLVVLLSIVISYTSVSDRFIDNCIGELNLSTDLKADTFYITFEEQQPNKNFTLILESNVFEIVINSTWEGQPYNYSYGLVYRNCYAIDISKTDATGYCLWLYQPYYSLEEKTITYTNIRLLKKYLKTVTDGDVTFKGKHKEIDCAVIGKNQ